MRSFRRLFRIAAHDDRTRTAEIDDELRFHVEARVEDLVAEGLSVAAARTVAERELGDAARYRDDVIAIDHQFARETRMRELFESVNTDMKRAIRALRAQPGFSLITVLTLAIGVGGATSVFSVVSGVLLRPLPYPNPDRIVHIGERLVTQPGRGTNTSYPNFLDWKQRAQSFSSVAIVGNTVLTLTGLGDAERLRIALVDADMFDVFGVRPALGRALTRSDNEVGAADVAVVTDAFWRSKLGADPSVVGRTIQLSSYSVRIVGVMPPGFEGVGRLREPIWANFTPEASPVRSGRFREVFARLRPGVTLEQAQAEMTRISAELASVYPQDDKDQIAIVDRVSDLLVGDLRRPLYLLLGASGLLLLIACANISNLLLVRGLGRSRELAVRAAIGATRARVARQLLTESILIGTLGSIGGLLITVATVRWLVAFGPAVFELRPPAVDARVLAATVALSILTTLLFGLLPALRGTPRDLHTVLRSGSARIAGGGARTRAVLSAVQLALAVMLLSASALVMKSFARVLAVTPGIRPDHLLTAPLPLPGQRYPGATVNAFRDQLSERLRAQPGVVSVAFTSLIPFGGSFDRVGIRKVSGQAERTGANAATADRYVVSPTYFETMGIRLLRGRLFGPEDAAEAAPVCIVDEVFARSTFDTDDPIGRTLDTYGARGPCTITGIVNHVKTYGLDLPSPGQVYLSNIQTRWTSSSIVVRTTGDPLLLARVLAREVHAIDPTLPVSELASMDQLMATLLRGRRFTLTLLASFGIAALILSAIGLYGVVAFAVSERRREFSVRMALGAQRERIARLVAGEGLRIAAAGIAVGGLGAVALHRVVSALLFEASAADYATFVAVAAALLGVAMVACAVPARRATRADIAEALRSD